MATRRRTKGPDRYHHGDLRAAMLLTAWEVVGKQGLDRLSLRAVADALGVSHAAPAHHFPDKGALVEALRGETWRRFAGALEAAPGRGLRATGEAYVHFALRHPRQLQLLFGPGRSPLEEADSGARRAWEVLRQGVAAEVGPRRAANEAGLEALCLAAWSAVHGFSALAIAGVVTSAQTAAQLERLLDVVLKGLRAR